MTFASVELVHDAVPGRVRYRVAGLGRRPDVRAVLLRSLEELAGVVDARASDTTGTVLVVFGGGISAERIANVLRDTLRAHAANETAPAETSPSPATWWWSARLRGERAVGEAARAARAATQATEGLVSRLRARFARRQLAPPAPPAAAREALVEATWHTEEALAIAALLEVDPERGLSDEAWDARRRAEGPNAIPVPPMRSDLRIFLDQLASTPVAMLGVSAALSVATGGIADALAIVAVIGINAAIGYITERGAERSIAALTYLPSAAVLVRRAGEERAVAVEEIARGDLLVLRTGLFIPADARLVEADDLTVDESSLTGESMPVHKSVAPLSGGEIPLGDRVNMVYRGTLVTGGAGLALVVAIGARTEIGRIQALASSVEVRRTPMQEHLDHLGRQLAIGASLACVATMGVGLLRGQALLPMFRTAVSLGVAAVPEGLPTVAVTTLALGLARMREQRALVRQLASVETLGSVQVVCLDKTGTITVNRMTVVALQAGLALRDVRPDGALDAGDPDLAWLLRVAVLCNEVTLRDDEGVQVLDGSPTESALVQLALDAGVDVAAERAAHPLRAVQRRAQARNYMATVHDGDAGRLIAVKGRPSEVLALCASCLAGGERRPLSDGERARIESDNERLAGRALRVLGLAFLDGVAETDALPAELVWVGLIGMEDPPREGVGEVIASFRRAGVRTVMITGDQSATAQAVGRQINLGAGGHLEIVDSTRLDRVAPDVLRALAERADVFSRVSPAHKLQIVRALQDAGLIVAMTGDGVNDGPALRAANIGIAMGSGGANAARELADLILEDNQLATLVHAIEQGRTIYDDVRKAVHFILATNLSEILFTFAGVVAGNGSPLTPMQLLWINLLTDIFPELALAVEPPARDVLTRAPRDPARKMFDGADLLRIGLEGTVITAGAIAAYLAASRGGDPARAGSVGFTALTAAQLLHAWSARSETHTIFDREHLARSKWLPLALGGTGLLQLLGSLVPGLRTLLGTVPLGLADWGIVLASAVGPFLINETIKLALRGPAEAA